MRNDGRDRPRQDEQGPPEFLKRHVIVVDNQSLEETAEENRHRGENRPNDRPKEDTPKDFAKRNGDIADASEAEDIDEIAETDPVEQTDVRFVIGEAQEANRIGMMEIKVTRKIAGNKMMYSNDRSYTSLK